MTHPSDMAHPRRWLDWQQQAQNPAVDHDLRRLYRDLDAAIADRGPTCWASGKCCHFDRYGHRLYVTGLEIAWFLAQIAPNTLPPESETTPDLAPVNASRTVRLPRFAESPGACPYQIDGRCSTHTVRPLGCRIFFCQAGTESWQQDLYETYLQQLQGLHRTHTIDYHYLDWMAGLDFATPVLAPSAAPIP